MLQKYNRYRVVQEFFNSPRRGFYVRELARLTGIAQPSVNNHLKALAESGLVMKDMTGLYPSFKANMESEAYKLHKKTNMMMQISNTGLLGHIYDSCLPASIILFGSASKGEDSEASDIDLFVQSPAKKVNLEKYSKLLHREIHVLFEEKFNKLGPELKNNILNGIVLKGYIKVF